MKKFQLQITIEQKEIWRISQIDAPENPSGAANAKTVSLLLAEKTEDFSPPVYRVPRFFQSFSGRLNRFIKVFRLAGRREK